MKPVTVHLAHSNILSSFYFTEDAPALARSSLAAGQYTPVPTEVFESFTGEEAAEEVFDMTNNPYRQPERSVCYGRGRSVSVGDMVEVDGTKWLCRPRGWVIV